MLVNYNGPTFGISCLAWSPDGVYLAYACGRQVGLLDMEAGRTFLQELQPPPGISKERKCLAWSPSGRTLAVGSDLIEFWKMDSRGRLFMYAKLRHTRDQVSSLALSDDPISLALSHHPISGMLAMSGTTTGDAEILKA